MYYLLSGGLIIFGLIGLYGSLFKYTREQHKKTKFTRQVKVLMVFSWQ